MLKQWDALNVFYDTGQVEIDNNIENNTLQNVALRRGHYLQSTEHLQAACCGTKELIT